MSGGLGLVDDDVVGLTDRESAPANESTQKPIPSWKSWKLSPSSSLVALCRSWVINALGALTVARTFRASTICRTHSEGPRKPTFASGSNWPGRAKAEFKLAAVNQSSKAAQWGKF